MSEAAATERRRTTDPILQEILQEQKETRKDVARLRDEVKDRQMYQRLADQEIKRIANKVEGAEGDGGIERDVKDMQSRLYLAAGGVAVILWGLEHLFSK